MNLALCFLAYGDEHIKEFNLLADDLLYYNSSIKIFVVTNNSNQINNKDINIIETKEEFNFNLKRYGVQEALKQYDDVLLLDTDLKFRDKTFSFLNNVESNGVYVPWIDKTLLHKDFRLTPDNNSYCKKLNHYNESEYRLMFIPEYCIYIKLSDDIDKENFILNWSYLYEETKDVQLLDRENSKLKGAVEGCIIYLSCLNSNIPIKQSGDSLFGTITHYASNSITTSLI